VTEHASVWLGVDDRPNYPALTGDAQADVVVIGAGITGLTTALLLQRAGRSVTVIDLHRVASGTTGHTTGKVTSQHGLIYAELAQHRGEGTARAYGEANEAGVTMIAELAEETGADCGVTRAPAYVYTTEQRYVADIDEEAVVAARLGLPARLADPDEVQLDGVRAALRFDDQLHFDAARYCDALAAAVVAGGGDVHEGTRATGVRDRRDHVIVRTPFGNVRASDVVVATLLPFIDIDGFFARARATRAYGLAARVSDADRVGMYITAENPTRSTRPWRHPGGTGVIVVGEEHDTGAEVDTAPHYAALEQWTRSNFEVESVDFTWSAQDYTTLDDIPYAGRSPLRRHTWVATGFRKWGLTNGTAAATVVAEGIMRRTHPWQSLYEPSRLGGRRAVMRFVTDNAKVARHFVGDWLGRAGARPVERLAAGEGGVVRNGARVYGAYRDRDGTVHGVGLTCTHLGCTVRWNAAETTWDCPCHGSRFGHDGTVLQGPAKRDLPPKP